MIINMILDVSLIIGFGLLHSLLASFKSKKIGGKIFTPALYRLFFSLITAFYILIAAYYWRFIPYLIYDAPSPYVNIFRGIVFAGWFMYFFSHLAYYEVGGVFGTSQLFAKCQLMASARFDYSTNGLKKFLRFPVHTAFFLMFLAVPTMYLSTLIFAILASLYAWLGTKHHDYRYSKIFGEEYKNYKENSGMVLPKFRNCKLIGYSTVILDKTARNRSLRLIWLTTPILVCTNLWFLYQKNIILDNKSSLIYLPLITLIGGIISSIISAIFIRNYKFTTNKTLNLQNSECVAFGYGCAIAISLFCLFIFNYYLYGNFPNFSAVIPSWVLTLLIMHSIYFVIEYSFFHLSVGKIQEKIKCL